MVRALLAGQKTQTRRALRYQPKGYNGRYFVMDDDLPEAWQDCDNIVELCPHGQVGDLLWVRETWAAPHAYDHLPPRLIPQEANIHCLASEERGGLMWRPSIFMLRWASRLTLPIKSVRVEQLNDISEADAKAEGRTLELLHHDYFPATWEEIHGDGAWRLNPWVWVIEFEVIKSNVDQVLKEAA
ncbi:MAG TPA: hypothetical protein VGH91_04765 [Gammaproteobacteria bacterium]